MSHLIEVCTRLALAAYATVVCATAGQAADNFRYISSTGNNAKPCTLSQPCRTLQRGVSVTPPGGELRILDSGFFGNNGSINKSMTVSGNGNTVHLGAPITINAAGATVAVRGLVLSGEGTTSDGIAVTAAAQVFIERSVMHGFTTHGIVIDGAGDVFVTDSISRGNGDSGLRVLGAATGRLAVDNSHFEGNGNTGLNISGGTATINRSVASGNVNDGIFVEAASMNVTSTEASHNGSGTRGGFFVNSGGFMTLESCVGRGNNLFGLRTNVGGTARVSNSVFSDNTIGISNAGTVLTRGNNTVSGNTTQASGTALTALGGI
jgi:Right handed beta helix region